MGEKYTGGPAASRWRMVLQMSRIAGAALISMGTISPKAMAQDFAHVSSLSSGELRRLCNSDEEAPSRRGVSLTPCTSYILGAADQLSISKAFCLSSSDYAMLVIDKVMSHLRKHPEEGSQPPAISIRTALNQAFPCTDI